MIKRLLIAEDDIKFTAPGAFRYYLNNIPADFDLYPGGIIYGKINNNQTVNDFSGIMLYMINSKFYNIFLDIAENKHQDRGLKNKGVYIVCNPMVAIQHNGYSDNNKREMDYSPYIKSRNLFT